MYMLGDAWQEELSCPKCVFVKPNLTFPVYKEGVTTRFEYVRLLVEVLHELNPDTTIYIGEGDGGYNSFSMTKVLTNMGYFKRRYYQEPS